MNAIAELDAELHAAPRPSRLAAQAGHDLFDAELGAAPLGDRSSRRPRWRP
jgi:hypothetical protein